jgi:intracellular sulfur oxidation DsrE/DsrF family protein
MSKDWAGLTQARAVWDFTTGDGRRFCDRLKLVIDAAEQFKEHGIASDFVVLLHGAATQFAARTLAGTKFEQREAPDLPAAHKLLQHFADIGGRIEVCRIAMDRSAVTPDNIIGCAVIEYNVFVNSVALQNRGYAYMPIS